MKTILDYPIQIPKDRHLKQLSTVLDQDKILKVLRKAELSDHGQLLATSYQSHYLRYKPRLNCISVFTLEARDKEKEKTYQHLYYGKTYGHFPFTTISDRGPSRSFFPTDPFPPVVVLRDLKMICFAFPNDRVLKSLRRLADPRQLRRLMARHLLKAESGESRMPLKKIKLEPVRYVPEKRCLLRCHLSIKSHKSGEVKKDRLFIKAYSDDSSAEVYSIMKQLRPRLREKSDNKISIPKPKGFDPDLKLVIIREVPGVHLWKKAEEPGFSKAVEKSALALATLNSIEVRTGRRFDTQNEVAALKKQALAVAELIPGCREQIDAILDYLYAKRPTLTNSKLFSVHGDYYHNQILVQNQIIYILDFDRFHRGDPLLDVGNFLAQLRVLAQRYPSINYSETSEAFKSVYFGRLPQVYSDSRLRWYLVLAYLRLVMETVCLLRPKWPELVEQLVVWAGEEAAR